MTLVLAEKDRSWIETPNVEYRIWDHTVRPYGIDLRLVDKLEEVAEEIKKEMLRNPDDPPPRQTPPLKY